MEKNIKILGVRVDGYSAGEIKEKIRNCLERDSGSNFFTTLNPEIVLKGKKDKGYQNILNSADLNLCDGFGLRLVGGLKGKKLHRFTGVDLVDFLLDLSEQKKYKILVAMTYKSLSSPQEIKLKIKEKYPNIDIFADYYSGSQKWFDNAIIKAAEIVFINFGAPDQEKFIFENREKFSKAKILVGIGGAFDFFTGKIQRAPKIWRAAGFEWLWRLIQEPKRFQRIVNAVIVFPFLAIWE